MKISTALSDVKAQELKNATKCGNTSPYENVILYDQHANPHYISISLPIPAYRECRHFYDGSWALRPWRLLTMSTWSWCKQNTSLKNSKGKIEWVVIREQKCVRRRIEYRCAERDGAQVVVLWSAAQVFIFSSIAVPPKIKIITSDNRNTLSDHISIGIFKPSAKNYLTFLRLLLSPLFKNKCSVS
jgi:hypothetical protein